MPDLVTHQYFGKRVLESLPETAVNHIRQDIFYHTTPGPDVWFTLGFYGGANKAKAPRGNYMHTHETGAFLQMLAEECRRCEDKDGLFSYLSGFLCHYALDTVAHPYIVYRTGEYDGSEETLPYRGNHTRLERAIDCHVIRHFYGSAPGRFSITDEVLALKSLPESLREPLNGVYTAVYGWENVWEDLNAAISDQRLFYRLMRGRTGLVNALTGVFNDGKSHIDYRLLSYHDRELDMDKVDCLNRQHSRWYYPYDPSRSSTASFPELMEIARQKAHRLIEIIYDYVYRNADYDLASMIGNDSYSTGLDCADPGNDRPGFFAPLF